MMLYYYYGMLRKLTPGKVLNMIKLYTGFHVSRWTKRPRQWGMPVAISIEPTTSCNLRCPQCPSGLRSFTRPVGMLKPDDFEKSILQMKEHLHSLTFYFQGEPYLNPSFLSMVKFAAGLNIYTSTSTNAHYLNDATAEATVRSGLDKLIISLDGLDQETYSDYRIGGSLEKVLEGTRKLVEHKRKLKSKTPHVVWQFVVFRNNEHQVELVKKMGREFGVDEVKIKTAQIYDPSAEQELIPENSHYSRYHRLADGTYAIKNKMLNQCWRMWKGCVITWDGTVVPCCFDKDATHSVGSLKEKKFRDIWFSPAYGKFRQAVLNHRKEIDICTNCSEGTKVWS